MSPVRSIGLPAQAAMTGRRQRPPWACFLAWRLRTTFSEMARISL
ncbi:hypothetical protein [Fundidesulfovibrio magnetotacticus]|nr:hypothetical protein [Fundidesulfovibrio magnetotacticus]